MFDVAFENCAIYCRMLSLSPCTTLCNKVNIATIGLQSSNMGKNCAHCVLKESMEFLG